jgi:hypothetical protein
MRKALKPAGQVDYQEMERLYGGCHCANRLSVIFIDNNIIRLVRIFAPYGTHPMKLAVATKHYMQNLATIHGFPIATDFFRRRLLHE